MEEIIKLLLTRLDSEDGSFEEILLKVAKDENLNEDELQEIKETLALLTDINNKAIDLEVARENNLTRHEWICNQFNSIANHDSLNLNEQLLEIKRGIEIVTDNIDKEEEND